MTNKEKKSFNKRNACLKEKLKTRNMIILILSILLAVAYLIILLPNETDEISEVNNVTYAIEPKEEQKAITEPKQALNEAYSFVELVEEPVLMKQVEMTFYLPTGNACANQEMPQENHTVAFDRNYLNCECDIYTLHGELIGHYVIDDTGYGRTEENGKGTIQNGNCIDVFFETESEGWEFIGEYGNEVIIKIYE